MLVGARAVQGAFGALLAPAALSLLTTTFTDVRERAKAFGVYGAIAGSGASIGLLLGGVLTQTSSTGASTMFVNLIFAVIAARRRHRRCSPTSGRRTRPRLDMPGVGDRVGGLFALVYGLNARRRRRAGATPPRSPSWPPRRCCWRASWRSSAASRTRCSRCGS